MAFKMIKPKYPPRHWSLVGYPGSGKSTFAAQMRGPKSLSMRTIVSPKYLTSLKKTFFSLSDDPQDNVDPQHFKMSYENMPGSGVKTIIVDSLTAIITPSSLRLCKTKKRVDNAI